MHVIILFTKLQGNCRVWNAKRLLNYNAEMDFYGLSLIRLGKVYAMEIEIVITIKIEM